MTGMVFWVYMMTHRARAVEIPATVVLSSECKPEQIVVQSPDGAWTFEVRLLPDGGFDLVRYVQTVSR